MAANADYATPFPLLTMATREETLDRIRKALGRLPGEPPVRRQPGSLFPALGEVLQPIPPDRVVEKFEEELQKVSGNTYRASTSAELVGLLRKIASDREAKSAVLSRNPILGQLGIARELTSMALTVAVWPEVTAGAPFTEPVAGFRESAFAAELGITGVEWVLAESGSLVLSSCTEGAQLASLAPPAHIALYRRRQALATLEEVLARLPVPLDPKASLPGRSVLFITGPSRTADIEQILIRGVHGPKEVHAILVEDSCF